MNKETNLRLIGLIQKKRLNLKNSKIRRTLFLLPLLFFTLLSSCEWGEVYTPLTTFTEIDETKILKMVNDADLEMDGWENYTKETTFFEYDANVKILLEEGNINDIHGKYVTGYIIDASINDVYEFITDYIDHCSKRTESGCFEYWNDGNTLYIVKGLEDIKIESIDETVTISIELNQKHLLNSDKTIKS